MFFAELCRVLGPGCQGRRGEDLALPPSEVGSGHCFHRITHPRGVPFHWKDVEGRASHVLSVDRTRDRENLLYLVGFGVWAVMLQATQYSSGDREASFLHGTQ